MFLLGPALLEVSARRTLTRLHKTHGVPALAAAAVLPAVSAALDQHAAAVRDILEFGIDGSAEVPAHVLLAGYVRGLLDQARDTDEQAAEDAPDFDDVTAMRRTPPADMGGWASADWLQLRLAGVCLQAAGVPAAGSAHATPMLAD